MEGRAMGAFAAERGDTGIDGRAPGNPRSAVRQGLLALWCVCGSAAIAQVVTDEQDLVGIWRVPNGNYMVLDRYSGGSEKHFYTLQPQGCAPVTYNGMAYAGDEWLVTPRFLQDAMDLHLEPTWFNHGYYTIVEFEPGVYLRLDDGNEWAFVGTELFRDGCNVFTGHRATEIRGPNGDPYLPGLWSKTFYLIELLTDGRLRLIHHERCIVVSTGTWSIEGDQFSAKVPGGSHAFGFEIRRSDYTAEEWLRMGLSEIGPAPFHGSWSLRSRQFGAYPCGTPALE